MNADQYVPRIYAPADVDFKLFQTAVSAACENVVKSEPEITRYDTIAGDGDCGLGLKAMAEGVLKAFSAGKVDQNDVSTAVLNLAQVVSVDNCTVLPFASTTQRHGGTKVNEPRDSNVFLVSLIADREGG